MNSGFVITVDEQGNYDEKNFQRAMADLTVWRMIQEYTEDNKKEWTVHIIEFLQKEFSFTKKQAYDLLLNKTEEMQAEYDARMQKKLTEYSKERGV